jgi:hypothetical protein
MARATHILRRAGLAAVGLFCLVGTCSGPVGLGWGKGHSAAEQDASVIYNGPEGLYYAAAGRRGKVVLLSPSGANRLVVLPDRRALAIDVSGIEVYDLDICGKADGNTAIVLRQLATYPNYQLKGTTRGGVFLVVTRQDDLSSELWTLEPYAGVVRRAGVGGGVEVLPAQRGDGETRDALIALLELPRVQDRPNVLRVVEASREPRTVALLSGVLAAAWCREGDRLLAVLSPAESSRRKLHSNLVEWDFQHETVQALGSGNLFRPPVADADTRVVCGQWDPKGVGLVVISRSDTSVRALLGARGMGEEYSDLAVLTGGSEVFALAWRKPEPHSITRWARLLRCDLRDLRVEVVAAQANCYGVCEPR